MTNKRTFCIKPWVELTIKTNGDIRLCCQSFENSGFNSKSASIQQWWNSEYVGNVRKQFLAGEQPEECKICWGQEALGTESLRQSANRNYGIFEPDIEERLISNNYPKSGPEEIDYQITNLCNLKCLMCHGGSSSAIVSENKILQLIKREQKSYNFEQAEIDSVKEWLLTKPRSINLRGGELFMVPEIKEILQFMVTNNLDKSVNVHITTNGTKFTSEWKELLSTFSNLRIMLSLDSVGKMNDYIRFGSDWNKLEYITNDISSMPNISFIIHATIMNLNILSIDKLISWCDQHNYPFNYDFLQIPPIMQVKNFPQQLIDLAKQNLTNINDLNGHANKILSVLNSLELLNDQIEWQKFKDEINMKDKFRKNNILDVVPELIPYW